MNKQHIIVLIFFIIVVLVIGIFFIGGKSTDEASTENNLNQTNDETLETTGGVATYFSGIASNSFTDDFVMYAASFADGAKIPITPGMSIFDYEVVETNDSYAIVNATFNEKVRPLGSLALIDPSSYETSIQDATTLVADVDASDAYLMTMAYTGESYPENPTDLLLLSEWKVTVTNLQTGDTVDKPLRFSPVVAPNSNLLFYLSIDGVYAYDPVSDVEYRVVKTDSPMTTNATMSVTPSGDLYLLHDQANTLTRYTTAEFDENGQLVKQADIAVGSLQLKELSDTSTNAVVVSAVNESNVVSLNLIENDTLSELVTLEEFLPQTIFLHTVAAQ